VKNNSYVCPSFYLEDSNTTRREFLDQVKDENTRNYIESSSFLTQIGYEFKLGWMSLMEFCMKLSPINMKKRQKNLDLRTQEDKPAITHNFVKVKPGKSYFFEHLIVLIFLFTYYLFFYKSIIGQTSNAAISLELDSFSINQVFIILAILVLMSIERTFHRQRFFQAKGSDATPSFLIKHAMTMKILLHLTIVILVHLDYGFWVPISTNRFMLQNGALVGVYLLWVLYFFYSALQIRDGYPQKPYKPFFTKDVSKFKYILFKTYTFVPFIWEMKVALDWTFTKTTLDLFQWFKIDDAYNFIYFNRY